MKNQLVIRRCFPARDCGSKGGSALLITLAFVILLTVLIVSFLSRAVLEKHISSSSANQVKSELFTQGVEATLIGDLEQEIINGSTATTTGSGTTSTTIYVPTTPANMVPMYDYSGCPTGTTGPAATLANLLKVSTSSPATTPITSTFPTATTSLSTTSSFNGRSVSLARWAESCLIDPTGTLPTPQWIMLARDGSNPTTFANSGASDVTLKLGGQTNTKTVIGRYAYVIYDEGGLIDMNVAGQPSTLSSAPAPYASAASYRNGETFADLTQIGMTQKQIDNLIGWRNTASAQISASGSTSAFTSVTAPKAYTGGATGTFTPLFTWSAANATNYVSNVQNNSTGNLTVANPSVSNVGSTPNCTDQAFTSRYELIQFIQNLYSGSASATNLTNANTALQYMTHFSRGLSQPSVIPPLNNPAITGSAANALPKTPNYSSSTTDPATQGGNTANGSDKTINPSFLTVRVTGTFTRNDGSAANVGDPLVKKRFYLNRLAWITYEGPLCDGHYTSGVATSASQITSNADLQIIANQLHNTYGLSWAFLQQGTAANIYNYFGLSWVTDTRGTSPMPSYPIGDGQKKWYYYHPSGNTAPYSSLQNAGGNILTLANVAAANREPDMVELLLAGMTIGSKAKAATLGSQSNTALDPNGNVIRAGGPEDYQNSIDTDINLAIVQVFANIIDQYDLDGYPTRIIFYEGSSGLLPKEICGVENLPYVYRVRNGFVQCKAPVYTEATNTTSSFSAGSITTPGLGVVMQFPEIWNPHDQNSPRCAIDPGTSTYLKDSNSKPMFPTQFRIVADSIDPDHIIPTPSITASAANIISNYLWVTQKPPNTPTLSQLQGVVYDSLDPANVSGYGLNTLSDTSGATFATYPQPAPFVNGTELTSVRFPLFSENTALTFTINEASSAANAGLFREPTMLINANYPTGCGLTTSDTTYGGSYNPLNKSIANPLPGHSFASYDQASLVSYLTTVTGTIVGLKASDNNYYVGFCMGIVPLAYWVQGTELKTGSGNPKVDMAEHGDTMDNRNYTTTPLAASATSKYTFTETNLTYRMQYWNAYDASPGWSNYDTKYANTGSRSANNASNIATSTGTAVIANILNTAASNCAYDPRTSRFSMPLSENEYPPGYNSSSSYTIAAWNWLNAPNAGGVLVSGRPDYNNGYWNAVWSNGTGEPSAQIPNAVGFNTANQANFGLLDQNNPDYSPTGVVATGKTTQNTVPTTTSAQYYADADGVVRRGTAAYFSGTTTVGLPLATANTASNGVETIIAASGSNPAQVESRPIVLNRPFKSVADLGYVFSGTPWKNLDFNTPESGDAPLLDIFTLVDTPDTGGLIAGKVNLNTQQKPVLQAILSGAYKDEEKNYATVPTNALAPLSSTEATAIATALTARTLSTNTATNQGPLQNVSELVGKWVNSQAVSTYTDGSKSYAGLSGDITGSGNTDSNDLATAFTSAGTTTSTTYIQRMRESAVRALASAGQTRVWNVMIDVVAQTGNYPSSATSFDQFTVQGEQRYWIHLAIDRLTGQIIDKQVEIVKE